MKIAILGDTHFGMRNDSIVFHNNYKKFYENTFFPYLKEHGVHHVIQLGDLFDRRKYVNFHTLHQARKYFFDPMKASDIILEEIPGNHDSYFKNTVEINAIDLLLKDYDNVRCYNEFTTIELDGLKIDMIPWICDANYEDIMKKVKKSSSPIACGHFEFAGFGMYRGLIAKHGLDPNIFSRYEMVLSGHYHHKSEDKNIYYVGSPGEITWQDYDDERGFHILDTSTRGLTFIPNPYTIFEKIAYDDKTEDDGFDFSAYQDKYVKVVIENKSDEVAFDKFITNLEKANVADLQVVENHLDLTVEESNEEIEAPENTLSLIHSYVKSLEIKTEQKEKAVAVLTELYHDALKME